MARKKIWAYATQQNTYVWNNNLHKEKLYFIWQVLKLKKEQPAIYNQLTFMSTQSAKEKRAELIAVNRGFFRYKSESVNDRKPSDPDGESISHEMAILALSEMREIKFIEGEKEYIITFDKIKRDDLKVRFLNGKVYYPDLIGYFSQPAELAERWGGSVAIEVKVTHPCESEKIHDFYRHNCALIEINLNEKMCFLPERQKREFSEDEMERYYHYLCDKFSEKVFMRIKSDPVMPQVYLAKIKHQDAKQRTTIQELDVVRDDYKKLKNKISTVVEIIKNITSEKNQLQEDLKEREEAYRQVSGEKSLLKTENSRLAVEIEKQRAEANRKTTFLERLKKLF
jgi:hypothetical protein